MLLTRGTNNYVNDADGNTLTGGGRTNSWYSQNRMVQCVNGSNTSTYQYGADGYRHRSTVNGMTTDFALDGDSVVRELRAGTAYATYLAGASGPMYKLQNGNGTIRWYLYDGLGSVLGEVDPGGTVTTYARYDVYGGVRSRTRTATSAHGFVGALGHTSEAETGMIYMRARYMDPVTGRFVSEDPEGHAGNWYSYVADSATCRVDRDGRIDVWAGVIAFALAFAAVVAGLLAPRLKIPGLAAFYATAAGLCFLESLLWFERALGATSADISALLSGINLLVGGTVTAILLLDARETLESLGALAKWSGGLGLTAAGLAAGHIAEIIAAIALI